MDRHENKENQVSKAIICTLYTVLLSTESLRQKREEQIHTYKHI
jgi:hypothetical protein